LEGKATEGTAGGGIARDFDEDGPSLLLIVGGFGVLSLERARRNCKCGSGEARVF
jgi:hypothetical protein